MVGKQRPRRVTEQPALDRPTKQLSSFGLQLVFDLEFKCAVTAQPSVATHLESGSKEVLRTASSFQGLSAAASSDTPAPPRRPTLGEDDVVIPHSSVIQPQIHLGSYPRSSTKKQGLKSELRRDPKTAKIGDAVVPTHAGTIAKSIGDTIPRGARSLSAA